MFFSRDPPEGTGARVSDPANVFDSAPTRLYCGLQRKSTMTSHTLKHQHLKRAQFDWVMCASPRTFCDAVIRCIAVPPMGR